MAFGLQTFTNGTEITWEAQPLGLIGTVRINNLAAGTYNIQLPISNAGGQVSITQGSDSATPDVTVSLGGAGTTTITATSYNISTGIFTITISAQAGGISSISYSVYLWRT
jgi:hypothetical protein